LTAIRDDRGDTPIMAAILANHHRAVFDLAVADPAAARLPDSWGLRPLDHAVGCSPDSVATLVGVTLPPGSPYDQNAVDELSSALRRFARCSDTHSLANNDRIIKCLFFSESAVPTLAKVAFEELQKSVGWASDTLTDWQMRRGGRAAEGPQRSYAFAEAFLKGGHHKHLPQMGAEVRAWAIDQKNEVLVSLCDTYKVP
jgi:hypothetical protein